MTIKNYIVYDKLGKITKLLSINESDIELNISENESFIEGFADLSKQYIKDGVIVDLPTKPYGEYTFNYTSKQWEFDSVAADTKAKQQRDKLLAEGPDRINPMWWSSMTSQEQASWTQYRQDLLDITGQADYPEFIVWPIKP